MNSLALKNLLLRALYIEDASSLSGAILTGVEGDVLAAINRTYQTLWTAPSEHFRSASYSFETESGTPDYLLDSGIQQILGDVSVNGAAPFLVPVREYGDFAAYATRFLGAASNAMTNGQPQAYHIQTRGLAAADPVEITMFLTPTPDDVYAITFDASTQAPRLTQENVDAGVDLRVPAGYVESIFAPVARFFVTRSHFFMASARAAELQQAEADFAIAMRQLGYTEPQISEFQRSRTIQPQ